MSETLKSLYPFISCHSRGTEKLWSNLGKWITRERLGCMTRATQSCRELLVPLTQPRYTLQYYVNTSIAASVCTPPTIMTEADITKLSSIPWAATLINDKRWTTTPSSNRFPKSTGEDSFFAETLDTDRTIRTMLTLRPTREEDGDLAYRELLVIIDLGDGLNGYPQVLHGGFAATLLDEACGGLIQLNVFKKIKRLGSQYAINYLTACRSSHKADLSASRLTIVLQT